MRLEHTQHFQAATSSSKVPSRQLCRTLPPPGAPWVQVLPGVLGNPPLQLRHPAGLSTCPSSEQNTGLQRPW